MNKLLGFYELKHIGIPAIPWQIFDYQTYLDPSLLWTIRVAVEYGNDINLPRAVGITAQEAIQKGRELLSFYQGKGIVIYYPFFIAEKSGILELKERSTIIEAVQDDLWNLTTRGRRDITLIINRSDHHIASYGNQNFLQEEEVSQLFRYGARIRVKYKDHIFHQDSVMAEWSYAYNTDINKRPLGEKYLVFYECRIVGKDKLDL